MRKDKQKELRKRNKMICDDFAELSNNNDQNVFKYVFIEELASKYDLGFKTIEGIISKYRNPKNTAERDEQIMREYNLQVQANPMKKKSRILGELAEKYNKTLSALYYIRKKHE